MHPVFTSENETLRLVAFSTSKKIVLSLVCPFSLLNLYTTSMYTIYTYTNYFEAKKLVLACAFLRIITENPVI